jgi:hypothetical protein
MFLSQQEDKRKRGAHAAHSWDALKNKGPTMGTDKTTVGAHGCPCKQKAVDSNWTPQQSYLVLFWL